MDRQVPGTVIAIAGAKILATSGYSAEEFHIRDSDLRLWACQRRIFVMSMVHREGGYPLIRSIQFVRE
jgi:hypothetical protein